jgi:hypothetical protein
MQVEIIQYPISDRYCHKGAVGTILNGQIRVGGCWFDFDSRWTVKPFVEKTV